MRHRTGFPRAAGCDGFLSAELSSVQAAEALPRFFRPQTAAKSLPCGSALRQLIGQSDNAVDVIVVDVADDKHLEYVSILES